VIPGVFLLNETSIGLGMIIILFYWFIGIAVISDILMDSISMITSKTEDVEVKTLDGKSMTVGVPIWNPRMVYLSLVAFGGALPEIFLCFMSTFSNQSGSDNYSGQIPTTLGPIVLTGAASFNLFMILGFAIMSVGEIKRMKRFNIFIMTGIFSIFAYVWAYIVIVQISPGYIEISEAVVTVLFYPLLLLCGYGLEKCNPVSKTYEEALKYNRRLMCR
jgi:solute carrier family 8 (sodium/calcium exchanger)